MALNSPISKACLVTILITCASSSSIDGDDIFKYNSATSTSAMLSQPEISTFVELGGA